MRIEDESLRGFEGERSAANDHAVVIAGGGPTGMMLAGELALAGIDVAIVEQRATPDLRAARSGGLHARSIEVLDQRGIAGRFLAEGTPAQVAGFAWIRLDISDFPTRHPYGLALWQNRFEPILAGWIEDLGIPIHRGRGVTGFVQDDDGVDMMLSDGSSLRAGYLVGCDGGRSAIRKVAGIPFTGWDASISMLVAEVHMDGEPEFGMRWDAKGVHALGPIGDGRVRVVVREEALEHGPATLDDLRRALLAVRGTDYGLRSATWVSRFTDAARQAALYRKGRVLLAGDAAHVHSPIGGQGLNLGLQDAVNLGWKLAQVVKDVSPERLLDTYEAERRPVAARVLRATLAQGALGRTDDRVDALRETVTELLGMDEPRKRVAGMMSGLDIHYDLGGTHPLVGRRMPDLDLVTGDGPVRVFTLLHEARPVLLNLRSPGAFGLGGWAHRVRLIDATYDGAWELPVLGGVPAPDAVLVRPDGHVAWVGGPADDVVPALVAWCGAPVGTGAEARLLMHWS